MARPGSWVQAPVLPSKKKKKKQELTKHFSEEDTHVANKHMEARSAS